MSELSNRSRRVLIVASAVAAAAAGVLGGHWWLTRGTVAGDEAKLLAASFPAMDGGQATPMSTWQGKTLIINFWATWCGPCREEMPDFVKAQQAFGDKGLQFVGIAVDRRDAVERFAKELGINYPILLADVAWLNELRTMGNPQSVLPFTLVVSPQGKVTLRRVGRLKFDEIAAMFA